MSVWEIPIPFSEEELDLLSSLATATDSSVAEYVRRRVLGPTADTGPIDAMARRARLRTQDETALMFYDRMVDALLTMRARALRR